MKNIKNIKTKHIIEIWRPEWKCRIEVEKPSMRRRFAVLCYWLAMRVLDPIEGWIRRIWKWVAR